MRSDRSVPRWRYLVAQGALLVVAATGCSGGGSPEPVTLSGEQSPLNARGVGIVQEHAVSVIAGDAAPGGRDGKDSHQAFVAWPARPVEGNTLLLWIAADGAMSAGTGEALAEAGWDEIAFATSPDFPQAGLGVYLRSAEVQEPLVVQLPTGNGNRVAAGLMEWSGLGAVDRVLVEGYSNADMTEGVAALPGQALAPSSRGGVVVHVGAVLGFLNDGSKRLEDVSYGDVMETVHLASNQNERLGAGTNYYGTVGFAGYVADVDGPVEVHPALTWSGGGAEPDGAPLGAAALIAFAPGTETVHGVAPASDVVEVGHVSGTSTSGSVDLSLEEPPESGDLLVAYGVADAELEDPEGWQRATSAGAPDAVLWWRIADGSGPETVEVVAPGSTVLAAGIGVLRGPTALTGQASAEAGGTWDAAGTTVTAERESLVVAVTVFGFESHTRLDEFTHKVLPTLGSWTAGLHDSRVARPVGLQGTGRPFAEVEGGGAAVTARFGLTEASYGGEQEIRYLHDWWLEGRPEDPDWTVPLSRISSAVLVAVFE